MKLAVIGSGISGLAATWYLSRHHAVTLCERGPRVGMDAHSIELDRGRGSVYLNAPMRVFFEGYYPTLSELYRDLEIAHEPVRYSAGFSAGASRAYFQYRNYWLGGLTLPFLTGRSLRSPAAWRLGMELLQLLQRTDREERDSLSDSLTLEDYLSNNGYSKALAEGFLYPAFAGICTCRYEDIRAYPAAVILEYLASDLTWSRVRRLTHGVRDVAERLSAAAAEVRFNLRLESILPSEQGVTLKGSNGYREHFDHVVIATQANQAAPLLPATMREERELLGEFQYRRSRLLVHTDRRLAPADERDWAPVNFLLRPDQDMPMASIWMNSLYPGLAGSRPIFETWNPFEPVPEEETLIDATVERPLVTAGSLAAVRRLTKLQAQSERRIWFCGSYAHRGIPLLESAVLSAKSVAERLAPRRPYPASRIEASSTIAAQLRQPAKAKVAAGATISQSKPATKPPGNAKSPMDV